MKKNNKIICNFKLLILFTVIFQSTLCEILNTSIEFSVPLNQSNGPYEPFTPLARLNSNTYLVWVDLNNRPMVTQQKCDRTLITVPLDPNPDYTALPDGHNRFSMGIDKNGYIHIAGDMHFYPTNTSYLPVRYQDQTIMYWISNVPYDITKGFTFAGGKNSTTAIPGNSYVFGYFFNDNNNELYYSSMVRGLIYPPIRLTGEMGVGLYKYNTNTHSWTALGGKPPKLPAHPDGTQYFDVIFWEDSGFGSPAGTGQWFNNYHASFQFDNQNNLHMSVAANVDTTIIGPTRVIYAMSKDGGLSWSKANGQSIPGLPIRASSSSPNIGDLVVDNGSQSLNVETYVTADSKGRALFTYGISNLPYLYWKWFNGTTWVNTINNFHQVSGRRGYIAPNGMLSFNGYERRSIIRTPAPNSISSSYMFEKFLPIEKVDSLLCISNIALKATNDIYGVGISADKNSLNVVKFNFISKGLPCNWSFADIGSDIIYGGSSDYEVGTYTLRSSGNGFNNNNTSDSLHFAYRQLNGNGTLIARIKSQDLLYNLACGDGIMMRESLTDNSKFVFVGSNVQSLVSFYYRTIKAGNSASNLIANGTSKWLKLVRANDLFSGYISDDGVTWTQVGQTQTISMGQIIYVGLVSYSTHIYDLHTATFDNVSVIV